MTYELTPEDRDSLSDYAKAQRTTITDATTSELLAELKKRYRSEPAILDYIEMIECEVTE